MLRVAITFLVHRAVLLVVALAAINFSGYKRFLDGDGIPNIQSMERNWAVFRARLDELPELNSLRRVQPYPTSAMFRMSHNPFIWITKWACQWTGMAPLTAILLFSNLFFFLFLAETVALLCRMVTTDMAAGVGVMLVFWPASYEMSLGSSFSLTCLLALMSLRAAVDGSWWLSGLAMAGLALMEPLVLGLLPLVGYLFYYFHRSLPAREVVRSAAFFLVPTVAALVWRYQEYGAISSVFTESALFNLFSAVKSRNVGWTFSQSLLGQTLTILFFGVSTVAAVVGGAVWLHRLLPTAMFLLLLLFSPYGTVASRAPLAGICLQGITGGAPPLTKLIHVILLGLGLQETYAIFS